MQNLKEYVKRYIKKMKSLFAYHCNRSKMLMSRLHSCHSFLRYHNKYRSIVLLSSTVFHYCLDIELRHHQKPHYHLDIGIQLEYRRMSHRQNNIERLLQNILTETLEQHHQQHLCGNLHQHNIHQLKHRIDIKDEIRCQKYFVSIYIEYMSNICLNLYQR